MNRFQRSNIVTPLFFRLMNVLRRFALSFFFCRRSEKGIARPHHASGRNTVSSQERNRNIDKVAMFGVDYVTYKWAYLEEKCLETKRLTVIEAAQ